MPLASLLIKLALKVFERVLNVINQQVNRIQQEVIDEIESMVFRGMDDFWVGEDAEMFKQDVSRAVQEASEVIGLTQRTFDGLQQARDTLINADQRAAGLVSDLERTFGRISSL